MRQLGLEQLGSPPVTDMRIKQLYLENEKPPHSESAERAKPYKHGFLLPGNNRGSLCLPILLQTIERVAPKKSEFPKETMLGKGKGNSPMGTYLSERNFTQFCRIRLIPTSQWVNNRTHTLLNTT